MDVFESTVKRLVLTAKPLVLAQHLNAGVQVDDSGVAVNDHHIPLLHQLRVLDANYSGDLE